MVLRRGLSQGKPTFLGLVCYWLLAGCKASLIPLQEMEEAKDVNSVKEVVCPPCDFIFSKLKPSGEGGKLVQDVKIQERGEPKSGTGFMFSWAGAILVRTCSYLQSAFGKKSCVVEVASAEAYRDGPGISNRTLIFDPALGDGDARCTCGSIERVTIATSRYQKHMLPVAPKCLFAHPVGIDARILLYPNGSNSDGSTCSFADGATMTNYDELWRCVQEAACPINDDWHQMAVFRDPRPVAVSAFYHLRRHGKISFYSGTVDDFVTAVLPAMAQWIAVRYILFQGIMKGRATLFWYQDALEDPRLWHDRWLQLAGLQLPSAMVENMVDAALAGDLGVEGKSVIDRHQEPKKNNDQAEQAVRKFENEVSPHLLLVADDALREWLPRILLTRLGVAII